MALYTANEEGLSFIRRRKLFASLSIIGLFLLFCCNVYFVDLRQTGNSSLLLGLPLTICIQALGFLWVVYYFFFRLSVKCNHLIQSVEVGDIGIKVTTFSFRTFFPPRRLEAFEFTTKENKLEIRKATYGMQFFDRELFVILHEGKEYYFVPYYFDDFGSIIKTIPFVKVA